jgi:hypothetical protein
MIPQRIGSQNTRKALLLPLDHDTTRLSNVGFGPLFVSLGRKGKPRRDKKKHTTIEISTDNQTDGDRDGLEGKTEGKGKKKSKQALSSKQTSDR